MSHVQLFDDTSVFCDDPEAVWLESDRPGLVDSTHPLADNCCDGLKLQIFVIENRFVLHVGYHSKSIIRLYLPKNVFIKQWFLAHAHRTF